MFSCGWNQNMLPCWNSCSAIWPGCSAASAQRSPSRTGEVSFHCLPKPLTGVVGQGVGVGGLLGSGDGVLVGAGVAVGGVLVGRGVAVAVGVACVGDTCVGAWVGSGD